MRVDLDHLAMGRIDERGVARRKVAETAAVTVDHLHRSDLLTGESDDEVMNGLGVAVPVLVGKRNVDDLARLRQAHRGRQVGFQFLLDGVVPNEWRRFIARHVEGVV